MLVPLWTRCLLALLLVSLLWAQAPPEQAGEAAKASPAAGPGGNAASQAEPAAMLRELVRLQFGPGFEWQEKFAPLSADLDRDGVPDLVLVARSPVPLAGEAEFHYKVVDPYDAYFGFGDPRVTTQFGAQDPRENKVLLLIHGAPGGDWRAPAKAKFVIINVPFDRVSLGQALLKKKAVNAIVAQETTGTGLTSAIYWTGKKYRWEPTGVAGN